MSDALEERVGAQSLQREAAPACWGEQTGAGCSSSELGGLLELRRPKPLGGMVRAQTITVRTTPDVGNRCRL